MLSKLKDPSLIVEAIWTPILPSDRGITSDARSRLPDRRVRHWWDRDRWGQTAFRAPLRLPAGTPAWDVYLVYVPGVRWAGEAPTPEFWMHQLSKLGKKGQLHGPTLREAVRRSLTADKRSGRVDQK